MNLALRTIKNEILEFTCVETGPQTSPRLLCWVVGTSGRHSGKAEAFSVEGTCGVGLERREGSSAASLSIHHQGRSRRRTCQLLRCYFLRVSRLTSQYLITNWWFTCSRDLGGRLVSFSEDWWRRVGCEEGVTFDGESDSIYTDLQ